MIKNPAVFYSTLQLQVDLFLKYINNVLEEIRDNVYTKYLETIIDQNLNNVNILYTSQKNFLRGFIHKFYS